MQEIVEAQSYKFPINFKDLSSILEGASEETFLLGDYLKVEQFFKREDDFSNKIINAVAHASFEVERKLVIFFLISFEGFPFHFM